MLLHFCSLFVELIFEKVLTKFPTESKNPHQITMYYTNVIIKLIKDTIYTSG